MQLQSTRTQKNPKAGYIHQQRTSSISQTNYTKKPCQSKHGTSEPSGLSSGIGPTEALAHGWAIALKYIEQFRILLSIFNMSDPSWGRIVGAPNNSARLPIHALARPW